MSTTTSPSFTFSMKTFGADSTTNIEEFFAIANNTLVLNQDIVASASVLGVGKKLASLSLHLKDGTSITAEFLIAPDGSLKHRDDKSITKH